MVSERLGDGQDNAIGCCNGKIRVRWVLQISRDHSIANAIGVRVVHKKPSIGRIGWIECQAEQALFTASGNQRRDIQKCRKDDAAVAINHKDATGLIDHKEAPFVARGARDEEWESQSSWGGQLQQLQVDSYRGYAGWRGRRRNLAYRS